MAVFTFDAVVAYSPAADAFLPGVLGSVYLDTDTLFTTPLTVTAQGASASPFLASRSTSGLIPTFTLDQAANGLTGTQGTRVVWKSGSYPGIPLTSMPYVLDELESNPFRPIGTGDDTAALNAYLAATTPLGVKRLAGAFTVSGALTVPADTYVDASSATITQTASNATTVVLDSGATFFGGRLIGKTTDYVAGNSSPSTIGIDAAAADTTVQGVRFVGFAGAAVRLTNAPRARVRDITVTGVHGLSGITIPALDSACYGVYVAGGCPDIRVEGVVVENVSIGAIASYDTSGATFRDLRFRTIPGQHGLYLQNGTDLVVEGVTGRDVHLNLMKVQLPASLTADATNTRISGISGRTIGDSVLSLNNPAADLTTAWRFRGVNVTNVQGVDALRVAYLGSIRGGEVVGVSGHNTTHAVVTIIDCQDLDVSAIASRVSGRQVVTITTQTGAANQRITLNGVKGYNPGNDGNVGTAYGVAIVGTGTGATDGRDILIDGLDMVADNSQMRAAMVVSTSVNQETLRVRNARTSGFTVNPYILASATRQLGEWSNVEATTTIANFPVGLPVRIGSIGNRTRWACNALPTSGVFQQGDEIENTAVAAGGAPGWKAISAGGAHGGSWTATTAYAVGDWRRTSIGRVLEATVAGTSSSTEPAPTTIGQTVVDGTVTWVYRSSGLTSLKAMANVAA